MISEQPTTVVGWRVFLPNSPSKLLKTPVGSKTQLDRGRRALFNDPHWLPLRIKAARCLFDASHVPPVPGCGCGLYAVESLHELLQSTFGFYATDGIVALVELSGGLRQPDAHPLDPPTTWTGAHGRILQLHLGEQQRERYGSYGVPVVVYPESLWSPRLVFASPDVFAQLAVIVEREAVRLSPELLGGRRA